MSSNSSSDSTPRDRLDAQERRRRRVGLDDGETEGRVRELLDSRGAIPALVLAVLIGGYLVVSLIINALT